VFLGDVNYEYDWVLGFWTTEQKWKINSIHDGPFRFPHPNVYRFPTQQTAEQFLETHQEILNKVKEATEF
jgi:hypothetical protein